MSTVVTTPNHMLTDVMKETEAMSKQKFCEGNKGNEKLAKVQEAEKRGILLKYKSGRITFWLKIFPFLLFFFLKIKVLFI